MRKKLSGDTAFVQERVRVRKQQRLLTTQALDVLFRYGRGTPTTASCASVLHIELKVV